MNIKRVLIVDDEQTIRMLGSRFAQHLGHETLEAPDGRQAWTLLDKGERIDLVISDYDMGKKEGLDGLTLLRRLRADERFKDMPFAMVTASITVSNEDQTELEALCDILDAVFVAKPLNDWEELISYLLMEKPVV